MSKPIQNVSQRLKELMEMTGDKQSDMARKTGIQKGTLTKYVNGKMGMKQSRIEKIAETYHVDPSWLLGFDIPDYVPTAEPYIALAKDKISPYTGLSYGEILAKFDKLDPADKLIVEEMIERLSKSGGDRDAKR